MRNHLKATCRAGVSAGMIVGGLMEATLPVAYVVAGAIFLAANLLMAFSVRKKDFNIEGADQAPEHQHSFAEKELTKAASAEQLAR
jgi:hypothetical protein